MEEPSMQTLPDTVDMPETINLLERMSGTDKIVCDLPEDVNDFQEECNNVLSDESETREEVGETVSGERVQETRKGVK